MDIDVDFEIIPGHIPCPYMSVLPNELLVQIFFYCIHDVRAEFHKKVSDGKHDRGDPYEWIRVTHVCRRWREVALACSDMWNLVSTTHSAHCVATMLLRSKRSLLTVIPAKAYVEWGQDETILKTVLIHLRRIETLEIQTNYLVLRRLAATWPRLWSAPHLRTLRLADVSRKASQLPLYDFFPFLFDIPQLSDLVVESFTFAQSRTLLRPGLRKLVLSTCEGHPMLGLLHCLRALPLLTELTMHTLSFRKEDVRPVRIPPVHLCHLRYLEFSASAAVGPFLDCLSIPVGISIRLKYTYRKRFAQDAVMPLVHDALRRAARYCGLTSLDNAERNELRSLYLLGGSSNGNIRVVGRTNDVLLPSIKTMYDGLPRLLDLEFDCDYLSDLGMLEALGSQIPISSVKALIWELRPASWTRGLVFDLAAYLSQVAPNVENISFNRWPVYSLCIFIAYQPPAPPLKHIMKVADQLDGYRKSIIFPSLRVLMVSNPGWPAKQCDAPHLHLSTALLFRSSCRARIDHLVLEEYSPAARHDIDCLKVLIPTFDWLGITEVK